MKSTVLRKKKIWEGFYLTILKVNKSTKNRIEVFTIKLTQNLLLSSVVTY